MEWTNHMGAGSSMLLLYSNAVWALSLSLSSIVCLCVLCCAAVASYLPLSQYSSSVFIRTAYERVRSVWVCNFSADGCCVLFSLHLLYASSFTTLFVAVFDVCRFATVAFGSLAYTHSCTQAYYCKVPHVFIGAFDTEHTLFMECDRFWLNTREWIVHMR